MICRVSYVGAAMLLVGCSCAIACAVRAVDVPSREDIAAWDRARLVEFIVEEGGLVAVGNDPERRAALLERIDDLRLLAGDPEDGRAVEAIARGWAELGETDRARQTWEWLARDWERSHGLLAWLELARLAHEAEDHEGALAACRHAIGVEATRRPEGVPFDPSEKEQALEARACEAMSLEALERWDDALESWRALEAGVSGPRTRRDDMIARFARLGVARCTYAAGWIDEGLERLHELAIEQARDLQTAAFAAHEFVERTADLGWVSRMHELVDQVPLAIRRVVQLDVRIADAWLHDDPRAILDALDDAGCAPDRMCGDGMEIPILHAARRLLAMGDDGCDALAERIGHGSHAARWVADAAGLADVDLGSIETEHGSRRRPFVREVSGCLAERVRPDRRPAVPSPSGRSGSDRRPVTSSRRVRSCSRGEAPRATRSRRSCCVSATDLARVSSARVWPTTSSCAHRRASIDAEVET
ncbi:MAG: hypothetical protein D6738_09815 [Acidobacteria bacterium]|nr:MAG: hypothetical protein D6738_09815 [Acidobacteriota bacterium]